MKGKGLYFKDRKNMISECSIEISYLELQQLKDSELKGEFLWRHLTGGFGTKIIPFTIKKDIPHDCSGLSRYIKNVPNSKVGSESQITCRTIPEESSFDNAESIHFTISDFQYEAVCVGLRQHREFSKGTLDIIIQD